MSDQNAQSIFVEDEAFKDRLHTCFTCEHLSQLATCTKSGLEMNVSAKLSSSSCPDGKWLAKAT